MRIAYFCVFILLLFRATTYGQDVDVDDVDVDEDIDDHTIFDSNETTTTPESNATTIIPDSNKTTTVPDSNKTSTVPDSNETTTVPDSIKHDESEEVDYNDSDEEYSDTVEHEDSKDDSESPNSLAGRMLSKLESSLQKGTERILQEALPFVIRTGTETNISIECANSVLSLVRALQGTKQWAFRMLDASGKPPSGILEGTLFDFGSFDQCLNIDVPMGDNSGTKDFVGKYCLMDIRAAFKMNIPLGSPPPPGVKPDGVIWDPSLQIFWTRNSKLSFRYGLCIPSKCTSHDIEEVANFVAKPAGMTVNVNYCQTKQPFTLQSIDKTQMSIIAALVLLFSLVFIGTLLEVISNSMKPSDDKPHISSEKSLKDFFMSFSIYKNTHKLLASAKSSRGELRMLNGMRFLSVAWVILGHTYFYTDFVHYHHYRRVKHLPYVDDNILFSPIANFTLSVDTFFFISGLLVIYSTWKKLEKKNGNLDLMDFFVHRVWRIWPSYMLTVGIAIILPLIGSGPLWLQAVENTAERCRESWWANMFFVNNFQVPDQMCLLHTWYLSVNMQAHILAAIILVALYK